MKITGTSILSNVGKFVQISAMTVLVTSTAHAKFLPENNLHLEDHVWLSGGLTEAQFNEQIDKVSAVIAPIMKNLGGRMTVERAWTDSTVNAYADQQGGTWNVHMFGGLARRPEVTPDGFAMVICHESGHHLGGFPFSADWAADEGQSDYFATTHCARAIWSNEKEQNAAAAATVNATAKAKCDHTMTTDDDRNLCYRTMNASKSLADLLAALGGTKASFETVDPAQVSRTDHEHPEAQCRLDTYIAGSLCTAPYDAGVIAGKGTDGRGKNTVAAERESAKQYCADAAKFENGLRPRCWFKPGI